MILYFIQTIYVSLNEAETQENTIYIYIVLRSDV